MATLLELRKKAKELGISDVTGLTREQLEAKVNEVIAKSGMEADPNPVEEAVDTGASTVVVDDAKPNPEVEAQVEEDMAAGNVEDITGNEGAIIEGKSAVKSAKKAPKAQKEKGEKKPGTPVRKTLNIRLKAGVEAPKGSKTAPKIFAELVKNDGRSLGQIAADLGTHYNMVRRVKDQYFDDVLPEAIADK